MKYFLTTFLFLIITSCEKEDVINVFQSSNNDGIIMENYCALGASVASMGWQAKVAEELSINYKNLAIGGTRWSHFNATSFDLSPNASDNPYNKVMANQLARLLKEKNETGYKPDIITILCGLNDAASGPSIIGNFEETMLLDISKTSINEWFTDTSYKKYRESVFGSTRFVIEQLIRHFPKSQIIIITPFQVNNGGGYNYNNVFAVNSALERLAKRYSIAIIDLFNESGITDAGGLTSQYLKPDGVHPNAAGEILLANFVSKRIRYLYFNKG